MLTAPISEAAARLAIWGEQRQQLTTELLQLAPASFAALIEQEVRLTTPLRGSHGLQVTQLLSDYTIEVSPRSQIGQRLAAYLQERIGLATHLGSLADMALFAIVDDLGGELVIGSPYVLIDGQKYNDRSAVVYYILESTAVIL